MRGEGRGGMRGEGRGGMRRREKKGKSMGSLDAVKREKDATTRMCFSLINQHLFYKVKL